MIGHGPVDGHILCAVQGDVGLREGVSVALEALFPEPCESSGAQESQVQFVCCAAEGEVGDEQQGEDAFHGAGG